MIKLRIVFRDGTIVWKSWKTFWVNYRNRKSDVKSHKKLLNFQSENLNLLEGKALETFGMWKGLSTMAKEEETSRKTQ